MPRVIGARVGQTLQVTNSDPTAHNVHSLSTRGNAFNISQPLAGMKSTFQLKNDDVVMRIKCDIHSWMISYVGVVAHPYFGVSGTDGAFRITGVPAGRHTIRVWHERYGRLMQTVDVKAGATAAVDFTYTGTEQPSATGIQDLVVPGHEDHERLKRDAWAGYGPAKAGPYDLLSFGSPVGFYVGAGFLIRRGRLPYT